MGPWMFVWAAAMEPDNAPLPEGCVSSVDTLDTAADDRLRAAHTLVVRKALRKVMLFEKGELVWIDGKPACWTVGLGYDYPDGHKERMGDRRTPEGWYRTSDRPWSRFYGALTIHYPNAQDAAAGLKDGRITRAEHDRIVAADESGRLPPMQTRLGGQILFHGGGASSDWTLGCVALDDDELDVLRARLPRDMRAWTLILR